MRNLYPTGETIKRQEMHPLEVSLEHNARLHSPASQQARRIRALNSRPHFGTCGRSPVAADQESILTDLEQGAGLGLERAVTPWLRESRELFKIQEANVILGTCLQDNSL